MCLREGPLILSIGTLETMSSITPGQVSRLTLEIKSESAMIPTTRRLLSPHHNPLVGRRDQQLENVVDGCRFVDAGNVARHHVANRGLSPKGARLWMPLGQVDGSNGVQNVKTAQDSHQLTIGVDNR